MSLNNFPSVVYKIEDEFQNQLDYYLKHDKRAFSWYDFHSAKSVTKEEAENFERKLRWGLFRSGYDISKVIELWPPTYVVSHMDDTLRNCPALSWSDFGIDDFSEEELFDMSSECCEISSSSESEREVEEGNSKAK
jgi:hypothetical protein